MGGEKWVAGRRSSSRSFGQAKTGDLSLSYYSLDIYCLMICSMLGSFVADPEKAGILDVAAHPGRGPVLALPSAVTLYGRYTKVYGGPAFERCCYMGSRVSMQHVDRRGSNTHCINPPPRQALINIYNSHRACLRPCCWRFGAIWGCRAGESSGHPHHGPTDHRQNN